MNLAPASLLLVLTVTAPPQAPDIENNPRRQQLGTAIERGDVEHLRAYLDAGGDVNDAWRDLPAQIVRSLLLRSVWYGEEPIFRLLLDRGADVASVNGYFGAAIHSGRVEIARTLLARGVKPGQKADVLYAAMQEQNLAMIELLWTSNLGLSPADVPPYFLTKDITRLLVPKYLGPNASIVLGNEPCDVARILGAYRRNWDGCEWPTGPLWLHFVVTGNTDVLQYLIAQGADLTGRGEYATTSALRPFTAMDIARARRDTRMMDLLRR